MSLIKTPYILFILTTLTACSDTPPPSETARKAQTTESVAPLSITQPDVNTNRITPAPTTIFVVNTLSNKPIITAHGPTLILEAGTNFNIKDDQGQSIANASTPPSVFEINYQSIEIVTVIVKDTTRPTLALNGSATITHEAGTPYLDPITASDTFDGNLTTNINVTGTVNKNLPGTYTLIYNVSDAAGNAATPVTRTVTVVLPPITGVTLTVAPKELQFSWNPVAGVDHYRLLENANGAAGFSIVANNIRTTAYNQPISVHKTDWLSAQYAIEACDLNGVCVSSTNQTLTPINSVAATLYLKASNTEKDDNFGIFCSLNADGNTLAVGARFEDSNATGINGNKTNNKAPNSGAVYIFIRSNNHWDQQAYIKASNTKANDSFGISVSLSADGNTLAVGARGEDSGATGINNPANTNVIDSGAVYLFSRTEGIWSQQAYIKASTTGANNLFGTSVSLSANGNILAVGANGEKSISTGINSNPNQSPPNAANSGAAYIFSRIGSTWSQQAYIKAFNTNAHDAFGTSVSISGDGNTLAVGAHREDSNATGINGNQTNNILDSGAAYIFSRSGGTWSQQAYIKASNADAGDLFGTGVNLSKNGNILAVEAAYEDSNATGINGNEMDNSALNSGAVYLFARNAITWSQQAYIKASNTEAGDLFGYAINLSADGKTLAIGSGEESSNAIGISGNQANNNALKSGAAYLFEFIDNIWVQRTYIKSPNTENDDAFGTSISLSGDSNTLAIGAVFEDSNATGINGAQTDNSASGSGAVYLY